MIPPLEIRRASVHEVATLLAVIAAASGMLLVPFVESHAIDEAFPQWAGELFAGGLVLFGGCALAGALLFNRALRRGHDLDDGLIVERAGLTLMGPWMIAYGIAVLSASRWAGVFPGLMAIGVGTAHVMRVVQINHDVRHYRRALAAAIPADPPLLGDPSPPQ